MSLISRRLMLLVLLFSLAVVWSHWNFFSNGVVALGFNFSLYWVGVAVIIYSIDTSYSFKRDWVWLVPIILVGLSFSLYENPWLKLISFLILPIIIGVFCAYSHFPERRRQIWNNKLLRTICVRYFNPCLVADKVVVQMFDQLRLRPAAVRSGVFSRVLRGIVFLIPLSIVVLLLLSSADALFGELVISTFRTAMDSLSWLWMVKLALSLLLTLALLSIAVGWSEPIEYISSQLTTAMHSIAVDWSDTVEHTKDPGADTIDGLVASIVLCGLLIIYILFLSLQLDNLVIEVLPENYREAEAMVKSGFWQLFLLAVLNSVLFFIVYRKTGWVAQWVLRIFIIASSLLMVTAAWKVFLYSYTFGLSYEKFFACYTAVFALGVLLYLVAASFSKHRCNVIKIIAFAALWGYGIATVSPVEKVIFHANLHFAEQNNTRITVSQLTQLSVDIMADVNEVEAIKLAVNSNAAGNWRHWRQKQLKLVCQRPWYELNLSAINVCR